MSFCLPEWLILANTVLHSQPVASPLQMPSRGDEAVTVAALSVLLVQLGVVVLVNHQLVPQGPGPATPGSLTSETVCRVRRGSQEQHMSAKRS